jgi:hypothetical protein
MALLLIIFVRRTGLQLNQGDVKNRPVFQPGQQVHASVVIINNMSCLFFCLVFYVRIVQLYESKVHTLNVTLFLFDDVGRVVQSIVISNHVM